MAEPEAFAAVVYVSVPVGEIVGWTYDLEGRIISGMSNDRVASAPIPDRDKSLVIAIAKGEKKLPGITGAIKRRIINGLITDERTAEALLRG